MPMRSTTADVTKLNSQPRMELYLHELALPGVAFIGRLNQQQTSAQPLQWHRHEGLMEICLLFRGLQTYVVDDQQYQISGGDVFITWPDEWHGSGAQPQDRCLLYWFWLDLDAAASSFLDCAPGEAQAFTTALRQMPSRHFRGDFALKEPMDELILLYHSASALRRCRIRALFTTVLVRLLQLASATEPRRHCSLIIEQTLEYIERNLHRTIMLETLAEQAQLSLAQFKRRFGQEIGMPPREYISHRKIVVARQMLASGQSISTVAVRLGFSSSQYFATVFRRYTGMTPLQAARSLAPDDV